jgi:hypothetical protein
MFDFINIRSKHFVKRKVFRAAFSAFLINIPPGVGKGNEKEHKIEVDGRTTREKIDKTMQTFIALHHRLRSLELNYRAFPGAKHESCVCRTRKMLSSIQLECPYSKIFSAYENKTPT